MLGGMGLLINAVFALLDWAEAHSTKDEEFERLWAESGGDATASWKGSGGSCCHSGRGYSELARWRLWYSYSPAGEPSKSLPSLLGAVETGGIRLEE